MNLPNKLTVLRIVLTCFFLYFIFQEGLSSKIMATIIFLTAAITDFFDGYYARKHNLISNFGKIMDPLADKFLMLGALFAFVQMHLIALWMFVVILIREITVTFSRLFLTKKGIILAAEKSGKIKTVLQIATIIVILFFLIASESSMNAQGVVFIIFNRIIYIMMLSVVFITALSGLTYFWNNRKVIFLKS